MSAEFDPVHAARLVLRAAATGALGTLTPAATPFTSLVGVATAQDGTPLLLLSRLAVHTGNLDRDGRCSLLLVAPGGEGGDPLAGARLTVEGVAGRLSAPEAESARARFLARHPEAAGYAGFTDFGFFALRPERAHLVAGFGRIHTLAADDLLVEPALAADFAAAEGSVAAHMNEDHAETVALYATALLGAPAGPWTVVAADADGIDLAADGRVVRLPYPCRQEAVGAVRYALKRLADAARAGG